MEKLLRFERSDENGEEGEALAPMLRAVNARRVMSEIQALVPDVLHAREDEDRARMVEYRQRGFPDGEPMRVARKLVTLRRQVVWSKTAQLAELVCSLLDEVGAGEVMSRDEAGVGVDEDARQLVELLTLRGAALRRRASR